MSLSCSVNARCRGALIVVAALAVLAFSAGPASAVVVRATSSHGWVAYLPAFGTTRAHSAACGYGQNCTSLSYHNGPVMHGEKLISLFWTPSGDSIPAQFQTDVNNWIHNYAALAKTYGVFSVSQQYYDNSGPGGGPSFVPNNITYGGSYTITDAYPSSSCADQQNGSSTTYCFSQTQEAAEVQSFVSSNHLPTGGNVEYLLFTAPDVGSCFSAGANGGNGCAYTGYCAYHSAVNGGASNEIIYANEPWTYQVQGCDLNANGFQIGYPSSSQADPEFSTLSHEINESMTDPLGSAWYDGSGNEIGDKCAYNYNGANAISFGGLANNGSGIWNQRAGGKDYLVQYEFSNNNSDGVNTGCVRRVLDAPPSGTVGPTSATRGTPVTFTANVNLNAGAGLAYIRWYFGDGSQSVVTTSNQVDHTYSTNLSPGTRTVQAYVTDLRGNEGRLATSVNVS